MKFAEYAKMFGDESLILENDNFSIAICNSPEGFRQVSYVMNVATRIQRLKICRFANGIAHRADTIVIEIETLHRIF